MRTVDDHRQIAFHAVFHHQVSHVVYRRENQTSVRRDHQITRAVPCLEEKQKKKPNPTKSLLKSLQTARHGPCALPS